MTQKINAQEWLDSKYPLVKVCDLDSDKEIKGKKRDEIIILDISKGNLNENGDKILVGSLKLEEFANLEVLNVSNNQLTSLDVSNLTNLRELNCSDNELMIINLPPHSILNSAEENSEKKLLTLIMKNSKNSRKRKKYNYLEILDCSNNLLENCNFLDNLKEAYHLESLNIGSNNFSELDIGKIKILKRLINLKFLNIGNDNVGKLEKGICNRFHGSLKSLENLPELEGLGISYTNIDSGLEYLPESIKMIGAAHRENIDKVKKIFQELENFEMNYQKWKDNWEKNKSPEKIIKKLEKKLSQEKAKIEDFRKSNNQLLNCLKQKTEEIQTKNEKLNEESKITEEKNQQIEDLQKLSAYKDNQIERQARRMLSSESKYLTSQIVNKQKELREKQKKPSNEIFTKEELKYFVKIDEEIKNLKQQISNLRLENYCNQIRPKLQKEQLEIREKQNKKLEAKIEILNKI